MLLKIFPPPDMFLCLNNRVFHKIMWVIQGLECVFGLGHFTINSDQELCSYAYMYYVTVILNSEGSLQLEVHI